MSELEKIEAIGRYNPQYIKCPISKSGILQYARDISIVNDKIIPPRDNNLSILVLTIFSFIKNK